MSPTRAAVAGAQEGSTIERAQGRTETDCLAGHVGFEPAESARKLSDWNFVTTWPEVGASLAAETFAFELHDTQWQLGPIFQRGFKRDADRIVTIDSDQARGMNPKIFHVSERRHFALDFRRKRSMNAGHGR